MISFAFSTRSCPAWDLVTTVGRAMEWGYQGIEIAWAAGGEWSLGSSAGDLAIADPGRVRDLCGAGQIQVACLAANLAMTGRAIEDGVRADRIRLAIEAAREIGSPFVKVLDAPTLPGRSIGSLGLLLGEWLTQLADYAQERGVSLLVENALGFRKASDVWAVMDRLNHPALGCAWDVCSAHFAGESPMVSVPVLNSRIRYARVGDANVLGGASAPFDVGNSNVPVRQFIQRLLGIGYRGFVCVQTATDPERCLPAIRLNLTEWSAGPKPILVRASARAITGSGDRTSDVS